MERILILFIFLIHFCCSGAYSAFDLGAFKAIYGKDNRHFISSERDSAEILNLSKSIALIVSKDAYQKFFFNSLINANLINDKEGVNLCLKEKFSNHHSINSCTGFLIGDDKVVSAGHCFMSDFDCDNKLIVFSVLESNEVKKGYRISKENVFECKKIIKSVFDSEGQIDFAVIQLNRKVQNLTPLRLRSSGNIKLNDKVFMIGHPLGLPQVFSDDSLVNDISSDHFFKATLDSFEGNSGSPVINSKSHEVEGILVRGEEDFFEDQFSKCNHYQRFDEGTLQIPSLKGEGVTRINEIFNSI